MHSANTPEPGALGMKIIARGLTDVGRKRDHNEDSFLVDEENGLFVVADGMGGHAGGGTASKLAVETVRDDLRKSKEKSPQSFTGASALAENPLKDLLREAVEAACFNIFQAAQSDTRLAGMGTTVTAAQFVGDQAFFAHVGDSRCYLVRKERIYQVSEDHSLVNEQLKAGVITPDEARHSRFKNIITRSVGFEEEVLVDIMGLKIEVGDKYAICCDGLYNLVEDHEILKIMVENGLDDAPRKLIELANDRGGDDNITVVVVRIDA
jgi:protein phosphatase